MDWVCSSCGRHLNWSVSECPHCRFQTTVTTSGTQPTSDNNEGNAIALCQRWKDFIPKNDSDCPMLLAALLRLMEGVINHKEIIAKCGNCGHQVIVRIPPEDDTLEAAPSALPADIKEKFRQFVDEQESLPSSFADVVNENFWDLL